MKSSDAAKNSKDTVQLTVVQGATPRTAPNAENVDLIGPCVKSEGSVSRAYVNFQGIRRSSVGRTIHDLLRASLPRGKQRAIRLLMSYNTVQYKQYF